MTFKREFAHSIFTVANRMDAWAYWSDLCNHTEPGVKRIELDGPFEKGATGRTTAEGVYVRGEAHRCRRAKAV